MVTAAFFSVALTVLSSQTQPAVWTPPVRLRDGRITFDREVRRDERPVQDYASAFELVDRLRHHDDAWMNILVGDADHDHRQEIVIRFVPVSGQPGVRSFIFYEDDGTGRFDQVYAIPEFSGGLLAMGDVDGDGLTDLFYERSLGACNLQFVRMEASSPSGFPDHVVWTAPKEGNVIDFKATIADVDGDGLRELVTGDSDFTCGSGSKLKVFESAPGDQMNLIYAQPISFDLGNPVVADFDLDGRKEIVVPVGNPGRLHVFEGVADNTIVYLGFLSDSMSNAYQLALVDAFSPDHRPIAFVVGQVDELDYRVRAYEMLSDNSLSQVNETPVQNDCGASIPQIDAADLFGTSTPEIFVDRVCDPVSVFSVGGGGSLQLFEVMNIQESLEIAGTNKTPVHSGAIVIGTFPLGSNPKGQTLVLELP